MAAIVKRYNVIPFLNVYTLLTMGFIMGLANYFLLESQTDKSGLGKLYLLMLIQLTPFLICFSRQHYDYISFVMFNHFFTYSIAKVNQIKIILKLNTIYPEAIAAIDELTICSILIILSYYLCRQFLFYRFVAKEKYQLLSLSRIQLFIVATYVICVPMFLSYVPTWLITLHFATMAADMVLLLCSTSPGNERLAFYLRFAVALSTAWYFLSTGFLTMVGNLAGYIFIAACLQRNYKQLLFPLILALLASLMQNVKGTYRSAIAENPRMNPAERVELIGGLLYEEYFEDFYLNDGSEMNYEDNDKDFTENVLTGFSRVGDDSLERVLSMTPSKVPFWGGESYGSLPFIFIPRILWNDKPSRHIWNKFGRTYGFLGAKDESTSVAVSYISEGYMNFGYTGMYCVALFFGFFVAFVERLSYYFLKGYYYFTFMCFLMPVMSYASDLTSIINGVFIVGILLLLFRTQFLKMARRDDYS